jgi:formiminotetrahydrofolate cyclodeaminase
MESLAVQEIAQRPIADLARPLLDAVSTRADIPGTGSVAALAAALAASIGEMAARASSRSTSQGQVSAELCTKVQFMHGAAHKLVAAIDRSAESEQTVGSALHLSMESKTRHSVDVSLHIAESAAKVIEQLVQLEALVAPSILSDLKVARLMATAAARGALDNAAADLAMISNFEYVSEMKSRASTIEARLASSPEPATQEKTREH